jgi:hypothetical protein
MKHVKVKFADVKYNYTTAVSETSTTEGLQNYFVGTPFDMGAFPKEDFQKCTEIEIFNT